MTKKHFEALARALQSSRPPANSPDSSQWHRDVRCVGQALAEFNKRFDYTRFLNACYAGEKQ